MYDWYWQAEVCYAYLSDVLDKVFGESAWFSRGWTLQELLAPIVVEFYSADWREVSAGSLLYMNMRYIVNRKRIKLASIGRRFSWAAHRKTTRTEDIAYSLLGIVDMNMPFLYGEGSKAFYHLQLELLKQTPDHTIFSWDHTVYALHGRTIGTLCPPMADMIHAAQRMLRSSETWGMLAPSPSWFSIHHVRKIRSSRPSNQRQNKAMAHEVTNMGLWMALPCLQDENDEVLAVLACRDPMGLRTAIWLHKHVSRRYVRGAWEALERISENEVTLFEVLQMFVQAQTYEVIHEDRRQYPCMSTKYRYGVLWRPF
jgi:hypothetical protein